MNASVLSAKALEQQLRDIGAELYHDRHPYHQMLHTGQLTRSQAQSWAINRYEYQRCIPIKDAIILSRMDNPDLRRNWRQRLIDHDGERDGDGGIARWLHLTDMLGLDRHSVQSGRWVLPATRFAVQAYLQFVRERSLLEAIASSLTELFSPTIISDRVAGMLKHYDFINAEALSYFQYRLTQAPRDSDFALDYVKEHAKTPAQQTQVKDALRFKCSVLWAQLDALLLQILHPQACWPQIRQSDWAGCLS